MGLMEIVLTVCAIAQASACQDQHLQFVGNESLAQCTMAAPPYIARWITDHPHWKAVRWHCEYPGQRRDI